MTSESIFNVGIEAVYALDKVHSKTSDNTALNTGKKSGINKRLVNFYKHHCDRMSIPHKLKGPRAMQDAAMIKHFKNIQKPDLRNLLAAKNLRLQSKKLQLFIQ